MVKGQAHVNTSSSFSGILAVSALTLAGMTTGTAQHSAQAK